MTDPGSIVVRRALPEDRPAILDLCRASLGWREDDPSEAFFAWKHDENPFGPSPAWVAASPDGRLVGLRVFMRWGFVDAGGDEVPVVRAVDTATHPDWQGRGIFTRLTLGALPELADLGVRAVFNTPNDKSRPGYLKMGWSEVGRVPVGVRPGSVGSLPTMLRARTAAELWSEPTGVGERAVDLLSDTDAVDRLLASCARPAGIATERSAEYLQWRYRFDPLRYRAVPVGGSLEDGVVILRLRRRGAALECAVCEVLVPEGRRLAGVMGRIASASGADYELRCSRAVRGLRDGFVPAPQLGPILTWRPVRRAGVPRIGDLDLTLGDVELF